MVTAYTPNVKNRAVSTPKRPPLLVSSDNISRPKSREVSSRYLSSLSTSSNSSTSTVTTSSSVTSTVTSTSSSSSRRFQTPKKLNGDSGRTTPTIAATPKSGNDNQHFRAVSAERQRRTTPSSAEKMLVASSSSTRSLSVSFQGESYSVPVNRVKTPSAAVRKVSTQTRKVETTPSRDQRRDNLRPTTASDRDSDRERMKQRWPGRLRSGDEDSRVLTRTLDYGGKSVELKKITVDTKVNMDNRVRLGEVLHSSDVDSVSSDGNTPSSRNDLQLRGKVPRRISVHKPFLDPASPVSKTLSNQIPKIAILCDVPKKNGTDASSREKEPHGSTTTIISTNGKLGPPPKLIVARKFISDGPVPSPRDVFHSRGVSPLRGGMRAPSPSKVGGSSATASPLRGRNGVGSFADESINGCSTPSMMSFAADARRVKLGENRISDAHDLRLLYNRLLQWRFGNAKAKNTMQFQKHVVERSFYNAWVTISKLRHTVKSKRIELQLLTQNLKLYSILKGQDSCLESWDVIDGDHCNSISNAIAALEASTVRLPLVAGARADVKKLQEAISSAVDVMQAMASSVCPLLTKVEGASLMISELHNLSGREHHLLTECKDFLSTTFIPLQVLHSSRMTHVLQTCSYTHAPK